MEKDTHDDFKRTFGQDFADAIDINKWSLGISLSELYPAIEHELLIAKSDEDKNINFFRNTVFPRFKTYFNVPFAGLHDNVSEVKQLLDKIHRGFLFNGAVTACGATQVIFNTVPLSVTQIGVCLVNYEKQHGSYSHKLFRRDLRFKNSDAIHEAIDLFNKRKSDEKVRGKVMTTSTLAARGIKTYIERAILLERRDEKSKWILGSGSPVPYELMTGFWGSQKEMSDRSIELMSKMILEHQRFVYVHDCEKFPDLWTWGNALMPFEYLVIKSLEDDLTRRVETGGTRGLIREAYANFAKEVGSKVVRGIYKVSNQSQPQIFYGHRDHIRTAALIAMADSVFQIHTGKPMLLDLASKLCQVSFSKNDLISTAEQASIKADVKLRRFGN